MGIEMTYVGLGDELVVKQELTIKRGAEGPRHDPYSYTEYTLIKKWASVKSNVKVISSMNVTLHVGLREFVELDDTRFDCHGEKDLDETLELVGLSCKSLFKLERIIEGKKAEKRSRCNNCGSKHIQSVPGFPGEYFLQCMDCKDIIEVEFRISEVE